MLASRKVKLRNRSTDARAIDNKYHSKCWANHETCVPRREKSQARGTPSTDQAVSQRARKLQLRYNS